MKKTDIYIFGRFRWQIRIWNFHRRHKGQYETVANKSDDRDNLNVNYKMDLIEIFRLSNVIFVLGDNDFMKYSKFPRSFSDVSIHIYRRDAEKCVSKASSKNCFSEIAWDDAIKLHSGGREVIVLSANEYG